MAENKKSFTAYCDWKETFDSLPDEKAGQLIKHVFSYVNDENPQTDDILIKAVFAQIKATLKRDLKKWENKKLERSKAGILGNLKRYQKDLYQAVISDKMSIGDAQDVAKDRIATQSDTKLAVSDSVSVSVSVTDSVSDNVTVIKNLIKINGEKFEKKPSEILLNEYRAMYDGLLMGKLQGCDEKELLKRFDEEYPNYEFKDRNHFSNALKSTFEKIKKEKVAPKIFTNGKQQTSKFQQNVTAANEVLAILDRNKQPPSG